MMCYNLSEEENLRKVAELLYIFLTTFDEVEKYIEVMQSSSSDKYAHRHNIETVNLFDLALYNIEILNLFDLSLQLINTKTMIKNRSKKLLSQLEKFYCSGNIIFRLFEKKWM